MNARRSWALVLGLLLSGCKDKALWFSRQSGKPQSDKVQYMQSTEGPKHFTVEKVQFVWGFDNGYRSYPAYSKLLIIASDSGHGHVAPSSVESLIQNHRCGYSSCDGTGLLSDEVASHAVVGPVNDKI